MKKFISMLVILILCFAGQAWPATYYVDKDSIGGTCSDATGQTGTITTPWCSISRAKGSNASTYNVNPGDTVYIRGATFTFSTYLTFESADSGSAGNPITYSAYPSETVTMDINADVSQAFSIVSGAHHLIFDGLSFRDHCSPVEYASNPSCANANGGFRFDLSNNNTVQNCYFNTARGLKFSESGQTVNLNVLNNTFYRCISGIYLGWIDGVVVEGNIFKYCAQSIKMNPHTDGTGLNNVHIRKNFIYQGGWGSVNNDIVVSTSQTAISVNLQCNANPALDRCPLTGVKIYNNIFWGNSYSAVKTDRPDVEIYNNTVYRQGYQDTSGLHWWPYDKTPVAVGNGRAFGCESSSATNVIIKNNLIVGNKYNAVYLASGASWTGSNNFWDNPPFDNGLPESVGPTNINNYKLDSTATGCINQGYDLSGTFTTDYFGNTRDATFDIGAHEYGGGVPDTTPPVITSPIPTGTQTCSVNPRTDLVLGVTTAGEVSTCKFNSTDVAYASMTGTFTSGDGLTHTYSAGSTACGANYTRYVKCRDAALNEASTTINFTISPETPASVILAQVTPVTSPTADSTPNYVFSSDTASKAITCSGDCTCGAQDTTSGNNTVTFGVLSDGLHTNCTVTAVDANTLAVPSFVVDTTAPVGGTFNNINGSDYTISTSVSLSITCPTTELWTPQVAFGNSASPTNWETCAEGTGLVPSYTLASTDGLKTVYVRFKDGGANVTADQTKTITLDSTAPVRIITSPFNNLTCSGASRSVLMELSTNEDAICRYGTTDISYDNMTILFSSTGLKLHSVIVNVPCDAYYIYYARCTDVLGNKNSTSTQLSFTVEPGGSENAPTGGAFVINNGAWFTNKRAVVLNIECPTSDSPPISVAYGESPSPSNWVTCETKKNLTLSTGNGIKWLYVKFKDINDNATADLEDIIFYKERR